MVKVRPTRQGLSGPDKAAVLMLALGEEQGAKLWILMEDDENRPIQTKLNLTI